MDTPTAGPDAEPTLADRIEAGLGGLDEADLAEHPEAYEAMDQAIRAELAALERLTRDPSGDPTRDPDG